MGERRGGVGLGRRRTDGRHCWRSIHNGILRGVADDTHFRASVTCVWIVQMLDDSVGGPVSRLNDP